MKVTLKVRTEGLGDVGQVKKLGEEREDCIPMYAKPWKQENVAAVRSWKDEYGCRIQWTEAGEPEEVHRD